MTTRRAVFYVGCVSAFALLFSFSSMLPTGAEPGKGSTTAISADPASVEVTSLPCDRGQTIELSATNSGKEGQYVDHRFEAPDQILLDRTSWSTYVPAGDGPDVSTPLTVSAKEGAAKGHHEVKVRGQDGNLTVPVEIVDPAGENLARYRQAFASSVHPNTVLCGGVDGNKDSSQWASSGVHDRTKGEFPDSYGVDLGAEHKVSRVEVYTLDSDTYPAEKMGIKDFTVQVWGDGKWREVGKVTGNKKGHIQVTFDAVQTNKVRIVTTASNDGQYSRIIELEVYA